MERNRIPQYTELKPYDNVHNSINIYNRPVSNRKWWLGFFCAMLVILLLLYLPVYHQLQTRIGEIPEDLVVGIAGWNFNTSRDMRQYILPDNTTAVQQPKHLCSQPLFLLVIICSAIENFESRDAIRKSWGSDNIIDNVTVRVTFLLGQTENQTVQAKLYDENKQYDDIIQERFIDSYNNLTLKSVMLLKWVNNHCVENVKFVMKTDDDMYVNIPPLVKLLKARLKPVGFLMGYLFCGARPVADIKSKWYAPKYMYPDRIYPNYLSGTGYVMSSDTIGRLYQSALSTQLFHLEDVYITGMCARRARIKPQYHPGFSYLKRKFDPCVYKDIITSHKVTPKEMNRMYYLLKQNITYSCNELVTTTTSSTNRRKSVTKRNNCY